MRGKFNNKTKKMRWTTKISLVFALSTIYSMFMPQGWYSPKITEAAPTADGRIVYSNNTTTPQNRTYTAGAPGTFGSPTTTVAGAIPSFIVDRTAPTRNEHIAGYVTTGGVLYIYKFDGANWIEVTNTAAPAGWGVGTRPTVGGDGVNGRRFDIAYENVTGDAIVVYSTNANGAMAYRVWNGTSWTTATALTAARLANIPTWIKLLPRPGSDEIALTACDTGSTTANTADLTTIIWDGAAWGNEPAAAHSTSIYNTTGQLVQNDLFDMAWESTSGNLMIVFTQATTAGQYYRRFSGTPTRSWGTSTSFGGTARTPPLQMFAASDPNSNNIFAGWNRGTATYNNYATVWTGAAWSTVTAMGTTPTPATPAINKKMITGQWLATGGTSYAIVMWASSTAGTIGYRYATVSGTTVTWQTAASQAFTGTFGAWAWMDSIVDPRSSDTLMLTFSDANSDLWARQLVLTAGPTLTWTADSSAALSVTLTNATTQNFSFAYARFVAAAPVEVGGTLSTSPQYTNGPTTYVDSPFTITENFTTTVAPTGCRYTTDNWTTNAAGTTALVSGTTYSCTASGVTIANGTAMTIAMDMANAGGTSTHTATLSRTVDSAAPTDGALTATPASTSQINLSWTAATDSASGLAAANTYKLVRTTGAAPPADCSGVAIYQAASPLSFNDTGLLTNTQYSYRVCAYDNLNNASTGATAAATTWAPCTANAPTVTISAPTSQTITTNGGSVNYTFTVTNNDTPACGSTTFNLSATDSNFTNFNASTVSSPTVALAAGATSASMTLTVSGMTGQGTGTDTTTVSAAAAGHTTGTSNSATTTLSVCFPNAPTVTINAPTSQTITTNGGSATYTFTVRNNDTGASCGNVTFDLSAGDTNITEFNPSTVSSPTVTLAPGATSANITLTVTGKAGQATGTDTTTVSAAAAGHTAGTSNSATTTLSVPCTASAPVVTISPPTTQGITTPGGSVTYTFTVKNNDNTVCSGTTFNLSAADSNTTNFDASTVSSPTVTLASQATSANMTLTVSGKAGQTTGTNTTTVSATEAGHVTGTSNSATTIIGSCTAKTPLVTIVPVSNSIISNPGTVSYTVTVTNNDTIGCADTTFTLSLADTNSTNFNASTIAPTSLIIATGANRSSTLTVSSKAGAPSGATDTTTVSAAATGHTSASRSVTTDVDLTPLSAGDGYLLKRNKEETCHACHKTDLNSPGDPGAIKMHNSANTNSTKWSGSGGWGINGGKYGIIACTTCHTGHSTPNIYLINQTIRTPDGSNFQGRATNSVTVDFRVRSGNPASPGPATAGIMGDDSVTHATSNMICQVCHTYDATQVNGVKYHAYNMSVTTTHNSGMDCVGCHSHKVAFKSGESTGGANCAACHPTIWGGITNATKTSKHLLGNVTGTNDSYTDSGITWGSPLSNNASTARSCVNMCHDDHVHNATDAANPALHNYAVYVNSTTSGTRAATTRTTATKATTDYSSTAPGGMCLSCHQYPVDSNHLAVSHTAYNASAHNYTSSAYGNWTYTLHDNSLFDRNCTKCHTDRGDFNGTTNASTTPFGAVHYSDHPSLLAGSTNPNGTPGVFICYNCHGTTGTGYNLSGKILTTDFAKTYKHNVNADNTHNTATETGPASIGVKHVNCIDCHDPHQAKAGVHAIGTNAPSGALTGATGVVATFSAANWIPPTYAATFTAATAEYQICFKCHSAANTNYASWGGTGAAAWTNVGLEFSTTNQSYHPVAGALPVTDPGANGSNRLAAAQLTNGWTPGMTMYCSDCHESDSTTHGPHGSAVKWMLAGTNKAWPYTSNAANGTSSGTLFTVNTKTTGNGTPNGLFCNNCHPSTNTQNAAHNNTGDHGTVPCVNCHIRVPHGGKVSRLITTDTAGLPARYKPDGNGGVFTGGRVTQFMKASTPGGYATSNCNVTGCSGHSAVATPETW